MAPNRFLTPSSRRFPLLRRTESLLETEESRAKEIKRGVIDAPLVFRHVRRLLLTPVRPAGGALGAFV